VQGLKHGFYHTSIDTETCCKKTLVDFYLLNPHFQLDPDDFILYESVPVPGNDNSASYKQWAMKILEKDHEGHAEIISLVGDDPKVKYKARCQ
jgi:hypothetical protein